MPIKPGHGGPRAGAGRPAGVPNKVTGRTRDAVSMLVEDNLDNMAIWLAEIHENDGPLPAMRVMVDLLEYAIPKLARMEMTQGATNGTEEGVKWRSEPPSMPTIFINEK